MCSLTDPLFSRTLFKKLLRIFLFGNTLQDREMQIVESFLCAISN